MSQNIREPDSYRAALGLIRKDNRRQDESALFLNIDLLRVAKLLVM